MKYGGKKMKREIWDQHEEETNNLGWYRIGNIGRKLYARALEDVSEFFDTWVNFGDVNPREEGGIFIKFDPETDEFIVVYTRDMKNYFGEDEQRELRKHGGKRYMIESACGDFKDVNDSNVMSFAGVDNINTVYDIGNILCGWIPYYGGDVEHTDNYWRTLERYGIYPKHS